MEYIARHWQVRREALIGQMKCFAKLEAVEGLNPLLERTRATFPDDKDLEELARELLQQLG